MTTLLTDVRATAALCLAKSWQIVRLQSRSKKCIHDDWLTRDYRAEDFGPADNLGIKSVGGVVDIDCDCTEAVHFADAFLPKTRAIYGRASRRRSHWLFNCAEITEPVTYKDQIANKTLIEIRVNHQSMAPHSTHPDGEMVEWDDPTFLASPDKELAVEKAFLTRLVQLTATGAMIARYYNPPGARHDWGMALAGVLRRSGVTEAEAERLFTVAARWVHDEKVKDRLDAVRTTYARDEKAPATGGKTLADEIGEHGQAFVATLRKIWNQERSAPVRLEDFYAYMPAHSYYFIPSAEFWPSGSVNARIAPIKSAEEDKKGLPASVWLDRHRPVEQMVWAPGQPLLIQDRLTAEGQWIERRGSACLNLYRPPTVTPGDARQAGPWLQHLESVYPGHAEHIINWFAHRVQRPHEKINHGLVLGGAPGIGKDTLLEPVKYAVGPWNFVEASPHHIAADFNGFVKAVILRMNEARDQGDFNRYTFYDRMKIYLAAPPDVLRCNEKFLREYTVFNVMGVVFTTNYPDALYLPPDDRRHFVVWSELTAADFEENYWSTLWRWYAAEGVQHVAALLRERDLSTFDPFAPPVKTPAFWAMVDANQSPEEGELADAIECLGNPDAVTLNQISDRVQDTGSTLETWLKDPRNGRAIPHRMASVGYVAQRNPDAKDGKWKVDGKRRTVYVRQTLSVKERLEVVPRIFGTQETVPF